MSVSYVHLWWVRGFRGQSDVSEGGEHLGCPPVAGPWMLLLAGCLIQSLALVSHLIQTICCGSFHLCRIATTVMSFCCTLHVYNIVYQVVVVHIYY